MHVWITVHESFDTGESLSEMALWVLSIVEVFGHIDNLLIYLKSIIILIFISKQMKKVKMI